MKSVAIRNGLGRVESKPAPFLKPKRVRHPTPGHVPATELGSNTELGFELGLGFDEVGEGAGVCVEIGEDGGEIGEGVVADEDFGEDGAEIGG
jgi:hypothetical protein